MAKELTGEQRRELVDALLSAFPEEDNLSMAVDLLDVSLDNVVGGHTYANRVTSLVKDWAEPQGRTLDLIMACRRDNPGNPKLKAFAEDYLGTDPMMGTPAEGLPLTPEAMPFPARDERLSYFWLEGALRTARAIARLTVFRSINGRPDGRFAFGTGWLLSPELLVTNHHVIEARDRRAETPALSADFEQQARTLEAQFDYVLENSGVAVQGFELICKNEKLDYAVLRLSAPQTERQGLPIAVEGVAPGQRVNILQHSLGQPLKVAVRNNFVVPLSADAEAKPVLRYLTETEGGASGSPVLNDRWEVVALHHGSIHTGGDPNAAKTDALGNPTVEMARFHNEGTTIQAIIDDLPPDVRALLAPAT